MTLSPLLAPPLGVNAPLNDLERLWLETSAYYAVFDETVMEDTLWDLMAQELWDRREEVQWEDHGGRKGLSPYFCRAVNLPWPISSKEWAEGENPLKTAMGVNWERGLPLVVVEGIKKEGPMRLSLWRRRLEALRRVPPPPPPATPKKPRKRS